MKRLRPDCSEDGIFSDLAWNAIACSLRLSRRELQIVRGIFADGTESAIALSLNISPHTVHTHVERLHRKLGVVDRVDLVVRITQEFLRLTAAPDSDLPSICGCRSAGRCPLNVPH